MDELRCMYGMVLMLCFAVTGLLAVFDNGHLLIEGGRTCLNPYLGGHIIFHCCRTF